MPDPLPPGPPGRLIRSERVPVETGTDARVWRIMYHSESIAGDDIAVTGLVIAPEGDPPDGGWPVFGWAHGTTGIADQCAPSRQRDAAGTARLVAPLVERGWVVAATDYEGLGTPGRHPYLVGESAARSVIDAVRATRPLFDFGVAPRYAVWGHSQGGHAAAFTAQVAARWAPEMELAGAVAGAPPADLGFLSQSIGGGPYRGFGVMAAAGIAAAYTDADLEDVLTDSAFELLPIIDRACSAEVLRVFQEFDGDLTRRAPADIEAWAAALEANTAGTEPITAPLLIVHGSADDLIPLAVSEALRDRLCARDEPVELRVYDGAGHVDVVYRSLDEMLAWIEARLEGEPTSSTCRA